MAAASAAAPTAARRWQAPAHGGPDVLQLVDATLPAAVPHAHVRVAVARTTATYTDLLVLKGHYRPAFPLPVTPGYDLLGAVAAVGPGVTGLAVGDRVAAMLQHGGAATLVDVPAARAIKIRADVDADQAVCVVLTGVTAHQMLHRASDGRLAGDLAAKTVLVHGCVGGTGAMLVALARIAGVGRILGTCSAENAGAARDAGVTAAIDYAANRGDWTGAVRAAAAPGGVDVVFDAVGLGGYFARGLSVLRRGGKYVLYGLTSTARPGAIRLAPAVGLFARLALQDALWSCLDGKRAQFYNVAELRDAHPDWFREDLGALLALVAAGRLRPADGGRVWAFRELPAALALIAANAHRGKQVVRCEEA